MNICCKGLPLVRLFHCYFHHKCNASTKNILTTKIAKDTEGLDIFMLLNFVRFVCFAVISFLARLAALCTPDL